MKNNKEKQVEELEKEIDNINNIIQDSQGTYDPKDIIRGIEEKAKLLKAEIEKGCGKQIEVFFDKEELGYNDKQIHICGGYLNYICPECKNLIERLNKIIGEKE